MGMWWNLRLETSTILHTMGERGISRRGCLKDIAILLTGGAAGCAFSKYASIPVVYTVDQQQFDKNFELLGEIRRRHQNKKAFIELYPREEKARDVLDGKMRALSLKNGSVSASFADQEVFFAYSRFIKEDGSEVPQNPNTVIPNIYSQPQMADLLKNVTDGKWEIDDFESYRNYNDRYSSEWGDISALIPSSELPKKHFLFVFSRRSNIQSNQDWVQQQPSAFQVTLDGQQYIYLSLDTHEPFSHPSNTTYTKPIHDQLLVFITDVDGKILEKKIKDQEHWAPLW